MRVGALGILMSSFLFVSTAVVACGSNRDGFENGASSGGTGGDSDGLLPGQGSFGEGDPINDDESEDPTTCAAAEAAKSYVGCDYWPTITPNPVWSIFDYAVAVANTGIRDAHVTVTGPSNTNKSVTVPSGELRKIYLPWVRALKGADFDACTASTPISSSSIVSAGAYHLVSSSPVTVYQFNALEYKGEGGEELDGSPKDWSTCPGTTTGCDQQNGPPVKSGCFSFSNDASLLLPSTAMTNTYRVGAHHGASVAFGKIGIMPTVLSITATAPDTEVTIALSGTAKVVASASGQQVPAAAGGETISLRLAQAGDVAQLLTEKGEAFDFSGSLVQSSKPVQVITSIPCINIPADKPACDHIEETVLPAETLGRHYIVTQPTGPKGNPVKHKVRLYGNKDDTTLTYSPAKPELCPETLSAGETADCGLVDQPFDVTGSHEFGVSTFLLGAVEYDPTRQDRRGDPDQSYFASVEQFRSSYVFLAPNDYPVLYADVTATEGAEPLLDGQPIAAPWTKIGDGPYGVYRVDLTKTGKDGAHTLVAKEPVGLQVLGFGDNTSFQYPGGLNLKLIAAPPPK